MVCRLWLGVVQERRRLLEAVHMVEETQRQEEAQWLAKAQDAKAAATRAEAAATQGEALGPTGAAWRCNLCTVRDECVFLCVDGSGAACRGGQGEAAEDGDPGQHPQARRRGEQQPVPRATTQAA